jgi:hypothetical protein
VRQDPSMGVIGSTRAWSAVHGKGAGPEGINSSININSSGSIGSTAGALLKGQPIVKDPRMEELTIQRSTATLREKLRYYLAGVPGTLLNVSAGFILPPPTKLIRTVGLLALVVAAVHIIVSAYLRLSIRHIITSVISGALVGILSKYLHRVLVWLCKADPSSKKWKAAALVGSMLSMILICEYWSVEWMLVLHAPVEFLICGFISHCMIFYCNVNVEIEYADRRR